MKYDQAKKHCREIIAEFKSKQHLQGAKAATLRKLLEIMLRFEGDEHEFYMLQGYMRAELEYLDTV